MNGADGGRAPSGRPGVAGSARRLPMWVLYAWAILGAAYIMLIWKGEAWFPSLPAGWTDALDALVGLTALTFGLFGFYRQGALRAWVLGVWMAALVAGGLYAALT